MPVVHVVHLIDCFRQLWQDQEQGGIMDGRRKGDMCREGGRREGEMEEESVREREGVYTGMDGEREGGRE